MADLRIAKHRTKHPRFLAALLGSPKSGAEIGVERGTTTQQLLTAFPNLHITAVDPWDIGGMYRYWPMKENECEFKTRMKLFPNRVTVLKTDSVSAAGNILDGSLDFVFIDAQHDYETVLEDIKAWSPKVKDGGFVTGHDYSPNYPGVCSAVDEMYPHAEVDVFSSVWWVNV